MVIINIIKDTLDSSVHLLFLKIQTKKIPFLTKLLVYLWYDRKELPTPNRPSLYAFGMLIPKIIGCQTLKLC